MPPKRKVERGRTKKKSRKSLEERSIENGAGDKKKQEVESKDALENSVNNDDDESLSYSSESSNSIEQSKPWQKKKSPSSNSEGTISSPPQNGSLVAEVFPRVLENKTKRKLKRLNQYDSDENSTKIEVTVRVNLNSGDTGSQTSRHSSEYGTSPMKKKNKIMDGETIRKKSSENKNRTVENDESIPKKKGELKGDFDSIPKKKKDSSVSLLNAEMMNGGKSATVSRNNSAAGSDSMKSGSVPRPENGRKSLNKKSSRRDRETKENTQRYPNQEYDIQNTGFHENSKSNDESMYSERILEGLDKVMETLFDKSKDKDHYSDDDSDIRYDFFDKDKDGKIVHQAWIPMFPEDFSSRQTPWPLSWWGIVDPFGQGSSRHSVNPYQNPQHMSNGNHPNNSMVGMPPHPDHLQYQQQRDYNHAYNNNRSRAQEGWGNPNPNDSRGFNVRGGWHDGNQHRGPPARAGMDQWGKEQSYHHEKRR